ncbi:hypothetical protein GJAV_G00017580 [Gymnothorax javanicus]|nr:hypothetical protein GJAV_G00017580 [Gymnothorax javanicus]
MSHTSSTYTFTTCRILHPSDELTRVTPRRATTLSRESPDTRWRLIDASAKPECGIQPRHWPHSVVRHEQQSQVHPSVHTPPSQPGRVLYQPA